VHGLLKGDGIPSLRDHGDTGEDAHACIASIPLMSVALRDAHQHKSVKL
jgi:hypothetical protein